MARHKRKANNAPDEEDDDDAQGSNDSKQLILAEIEAELQALDAAGVAGEIEHQLEHWGVQDPEATLAQVSSRAFRNFEVPSNEHITFQGQGSGFLDMELAAWKHEARGMLLMQRVRELSAELEPQVFDQAGRILEAIFYAKKLVFSALFAKHASMVASAGSDAPILPEEMDKRFGLWGLRFRWIGEGSADLTAFQNLLLYTLDVAQERGYRKQDDHVMRQVFSEDNKATHAWMPICTIAEFVDECSDKETSWEAWRWKTSSASMRENVIDHLTKANDYQFPKLVRHRSTFSFTNGIYRADRDEFCDFDSVGSTIAAAKYFDQPFPTDYIFEDSWVRIPTPHLDSVMDSQGWPEDVKLWLYVCLGRLLYDVGSRDGWQIIPMLLGLAGTGKSVICTKVAKQFYDAADVGVLSNSIEKRFGLSSFYSAHLFIAPELRHDFELDQALFQSMVSGEDILMAQKYKTATAVKWRPPGILAGNELPQWADASGSITRRVIVFSFDKTVGNPDLSLESKLAAEIPLILLKCNRAYLEKATRIGNESIWNHLPAYFKQNQSKMAADTNSIEAFLVSANLRFDSQAYMPLEVFKKQLKAFEVSNSYRPQKLTADVFRAPFARHSLEIRRDCLSYEGRRITRDYVIGVDMIQAAGGPDLM